MSKEIKETTYKDIKEDVVEDIKNEKVTEDKSEETVKIRDKPATKVLTYGAEGDFIVVELAASFRNLYNYLNKPRHKYRYHNQGSITERISIFYELEESHDFELLYNQTLKITLDNKESDKTTDNFIIFLNRQGAVFKKALEELLEENSVGLESQMKNLYV
ncbi:MAG: hypothetical protein LBV03_01035 [Fusobacteriales bacterium]|nr:hypothetical protein [Fusobacteriales bacterium]